MNTNEWKYCPICGKPIDECECGECIDLLPQIPRTYACIDYNDMDTAEAENGAMFDDMMFNHYLER